MALLFALFMACGSESENTQDEQGANTEITFEDKAKVLEALKKADLADGKADNIAHKCAGCALGMDGSPEHAVTVEGTTLHLCAAGCKKFFIKKMEENLLNLL